MRSAALLVSVLACVPDADDVAVVTVDDSAGVEITTLSDLPSLLDPRFEWHIEVGRALRTQGGDLESKPLIYNPTAAVPLADGRLLVYDSTEDQPLVIVDIEVGRADVRFGRRGRGPGEIGGSRSTLWQDGEGRIRLVDWTNTRVYRFSTAGEQLSGQPFERIGIPAERLSQPRSGRVYAQIMTPVPGVPIDRRVAELLLDSGEFETRVDLPGYPPGVRAGRIQHGRPLWTVLGSGVISARSDIPAFSYHSSDGTHLRQIRLPLSKRRLTQAQIQEQVALHGPVARTLEVGPMALTNALLPVDDSIFGTYQTSMWRAAEDPVLPRGEVFWRLLSVDGRYMGVLRLSEKFTILWSGSSVLWGTTPDATGVPVIQELLLRPPTALGGPE